MIGEIDSWIDILVNHGGIVWDAGEPSRTVLSKIVVRDTRKQPSSSGTPLRSANNSHPQRVPRGLIALGHARCIGRLICIPSRVNPDDCFFATKRKPEARPQRKELDVLVRLPAVGLKVQRKMTVYRRYGACFASI